MLNFLLLRVFVPPPADNYGRMDRIPVQDAVCGRDPRAPPVPI